MLMRKMQDGLIGVNRSCQPGLYLLQVTEVLMEEALQARAVLDEKQFRDLIARMQALLPENRKTECPSTQPKST